MLDGNAMMLRDFQAGAWKAEAEHHTPLVTASCNEAE